MHLYVSRLQTKRNLNNLFFCLPIMLLSVVAKTKALSLILTGFPDHGFLLIDYDLKFQALCVRHKLVGLSCRKEMKTGNGEREGHVCLAAAL